MDAKLNHSDFSALLSKNLNISASKAEHFTKAFFDILIEGLESDGIVKINGLGTFKMIDVASRGSVNVNTGEKIEIKGHRKLTFIPADALKDKINQPFAMFEPVEVDDDYVDDADEPSESDEQPAESSEAVEQQPVAEEQSAESSELVEQQPVADEQSAESSEAVEQQPVADETKKSSKGKVFAILSTLLIIIALLFCFVFDDKEKIDEKKSIAAVAEPDTIKQQKTDTIATQPPLVEEFVMVEAMSNLALSQITIKDTVIYRIKGTKTVHRIGLDETLTKISLLYFEDKRFWPYIVQYNKIKNYNSLEIGTELLIPNLVPRK